MVELQKLPEAGCDSFDIRPLTRLFSFFCFVFSTANSLARCYIDCLLVRVMHFRESTFRDHGQEDDSDDSDDEDYVEDTK